MTAKKQTNRNPLKKTKIKQKQSKKKPTTKQKLSIKKNRTKSAIPKKGHTSKIKKSKTIFKKPPSKNKAKVEVITYKDYAKASEDPYKLLCRLIEKESGKLIMLKKAASDECKSIVEILQYAFDGKLTIGTKVSERDAVFFTDTDKGDIHKFLTNPNRRDVKTYNLEMVQLKCAALSSKHTGRNSTYGFQFVPGKSLPRSDVTINTLCTTSNEWDRFKKILKRK